LIVSIRISVPIVASFPKGDTAYRPSSAALKSMGREMSAVVSKSKLAFDLGLVDITVVPN
jgi:hypothetical protein